jgi:DNA-binding transcriptional MerR regulator
MPDLTTDLQSGQLAELCGVSPDTIRHYERRGLIAAVRGANGYRRFPPGTVERVLLVRRALAIGFSLDELGRILRQRDGGGAPCRGVRALAAEKLAALDARIAELMAMREELGRIVEEWDLRLAATAEGEPARLLETLGAGRVTREAREPVLVQRW